MRCLWFQAELLRASSLSILVVMGSSRSHESNASAMAALCAQAW